MLESVQKTLNPKDGGGMMESITVYILLLAIIALNVLEIPVSEELNYFLVAVVSYMFGTNNKPKWDGKDRREDDDD